MKRVFALILVFVMLLSTALMCKLDVSAETVTRKKFYFSNWDPVDSSAFPNLYTKAYFWAPEPENGVVKPSYNGKAGIPAMAAELKRVFDQYPEDSNMRIINISPVSCRYLHQQIETYVFMEKGVSALAKWVDEFLAEYKRLGGKLDAIYSDLEYLGGYSWYLYSDHYLNGEREVFYNITQHPTYQTKIRPELEKRGFEFYPVNPNASEANKRIYCELYTLAGSSSNTEQPRYTWDAVVRDLLCDYLNEAIYKPLQKYYPDAYFTDYQSRDSYGWTKLKNENGYNTYLGGNTHKTGTHSSYNAYNYAPTWVTKSATNTTYNKPVSYNGAVFEDNAFHMTQWETNNFKAMYAATDSKKIEITLTYYDFAIKMYEKWRNDPDATSSGTPYHIEGYLHAGLLDPEFGGYVIKSDVENKTYPSSTGSYSNALDIVSNIMLTLYRVVGYSDRKPIETPLNWNDSFILSGMYANGRNVWRITPDTISGVSKEEFLVKNDGDVIFSNKGQTITFPKGSVIKEPISSLKTCGYWVETPADVMPIVRTDKNRYDQYPSFLEDFDDYTIGTALNVNTAKYTHTWDSVLQNGASVSIQKNALRTGDRVLAIQGNALVSSAKIPSYITAGDHYAKQQTWETTFSLSSLPTGSAEAKLLVATSGSDANADGGFRISNNTLYYSTANGYQAFGGFSLSAGTEYTLKRVIDFRNANVFTCSYYVYDANGRQLTKAENVSMANVQLPVTKINFSTENFGSNTLYVDDYTLNAIGLTNDLEIYRADTGILVDDPTAMQSFDTAYRLSWKNATEKDQCYNVVAHFSDGSKKVIETIQMSAGCDGVATGIVNANNKSVRISVEELVLETPVVTAANAANGVTVTWNKIAGAKSYIVYRSVYANGAWSNWAKIKTGVTGTSYTDTTLKSNTNVQYTVRAINGNYASAYTASKAIKYLATPTVSAANAANGVTVTWNKIAGAKSYIVYRSVYANGAWSNWQQIKTGVTGTSYTDTTLQSNTNVQYTVRVINGNYASWYTASKAIKYLATPTVSAANAANGVTVTWNKITGAKSYVVYRSVYVGGAWSNWAKIKTGVTGTSYTDTTLQSNTNVQYTVRAVNGNYASWYTASKAIKHLATPTVSAANAANGVTVSWNKITGAKSYVVYRSVYTNGAWSGWAKIKTGVTGTSYTDTAVKSGATVRYTVRVVNGNYASWYTASNTTKFLTQPTVKVAKTTTGINATWGKVSGTSGYIVYRRTYSNGAWSGWTAIKTTTALSFNDTTAKKGVTYQYTVRAYSGSYKSSYTNSSSIKR